ncbi:ATP-binding protein [Rhizomonospora bruguierae]|uniref:ATP-binding protein n=1 Tax=Rhizomonospora bruguierae TaxID=1581705 RepID=UPI001BCEAEB8|nr:ATP-binding protein [Micromonospora sp. NBRC 107566]
MSDRGLAALLGRVRDLEEVVRSAVATRRAADPHPDDPFRGLYLSDEALDAVLAAAREPFGPWSADPVDGRLGALAAAARLTTLDVSLLLVALAPDVDGRFEQFYGYLNDDVTRRRATVGLALRLCGVPEAAAAARARLAAGAPLVDLDLVRVEDPERPVLSRALRVPDRVSAHLLGADPPEPLLTGVVAPADGSGPTPPGAAELVRALRTAGARLAYLRERPGGSGLALGAAALAATGRAAVAVDARRLSAALHPAEVAGLVVREAVLRGAGIVLGPVDGTEPWAVWRRLAAGPVPLLAYGSGAWDPGWCEHAPLQVEAPALPAPERAAAWRSALAGRLAPGVDPATATAHFVLPAPAIHRAAEAAALLAAAEGSEVGEAHLRAGARGQNAAGLARLARRIEPAVGFADLVLPPPVLAQLHELAGRARHRERVLADWRMRPGGGRGRGVTALFAGDSGTGKTMSAEVVAGALGLEMYTVNLATVVDKYVGETEKNLERIFDEAAGVNAVLLFDEADAIFGKRSEVRDAHDRYANIESAYLLQRMETFDGLAVLATNLRANLDDAFTRRLDLVVDFPMPDAGARRALWDRCLGTELPRASDVDLDFLADAFDLAGGHIRSAAVTAAYLSAEVGRPVGMAELIGAVGREYRKLGRLTLESEFGRYLADAL